MIVQDNSEMMLTVTEVAKLLHVHPNTLRRWSIEGRIQTYRITPRGDRRFKLSDVQDFLSNANQKPSF